MPTYRSITLSLISQYDILTIPEYAPPASPNDPFTTAPTLVDTDQSLVSVYIPTYPSSQFWLSYSISPPHPPKLLYFFKLYIQGQEIVSWGCGEDDEYQGKTMFGLYDTGFTKGNKPVVERRALCFADAGGHADGPPGSLSNVMEVRVFRSKGRKRVSPELKCFRERLTSPGHGSQTASRRIAAADGIDLVNAGILPREHPRRFYRYALLDPPDQPFATFRYYYRSWDQLETLGVISPTPSEESLSIRSHEQEQQFVRHRSSTHTLDSTESSTSALKDASPVSAASAVLDYDCRQSTSDNFHARTRTSSIDPGETDHGGLEISPLRIARYNPPDNNTKKTTLIRPPTPPLSTSPQKAPPSTHLAQPPTSSREQFASLIRTHLPSPDPNLFKLNEIYTETRLASAPTRSIGTRSMSVLKGVVNQAAVSRRKIRHGLKGAGTENGNDGTRESELHPCDAVS
ncbi:MAG: hypothetical protein Q9163_002982 [Psora crenata]